MHSWIAASAMSVILLTATAWDLRKGEIPGLLTLGGLITGLLVSLANGNGLLTSLTGAAVGAGLLIGLVLLGGMGAGDAWLMAAIGAWSDVHFVLAAAFWASVAGGIFAAGLLMIGRGKGQTWRYRVYPYVPAIAVGTTIAWFLQ